MDWYPWAEAPPYPRERDSRADDPDYYYERGQGWIKRTVWTVDNEPSALTDGNLYLRLLNETTPEQRAEIRQERQRRYDEEMRSQGLVRWRDAWVTPERAAELEETYRENVRRQQEAGEMRRRLPSWWPWC